MESIDTLAEQISQKVWMYLATEMSNMILLPKCLEFANNRKGVIHKPKGVIHKPCGQDEVGGWLVKYP